MPAPPAVEDEEVLEAFQALFQANAAMSKQVPGGLHTGMIVSGTASPYARITSTQGPRPNEPPMAPVLPSIRGYLDRRHVTIEIYGAKGDVVSVMPLFRQLMEWQPKTEQGVPTLAQIGASTVKIVRPLPGSNRFEQVKERVAGQPVWKGTLEYEVESVRIIP